MVVDRLVSETGDCAASVATIVVIVVIAAGDGAGE
jgi:hypothetical protein